MKTLKNKLKDLIKTYKSDIKELEELQDDVDIEIQTEIDTLISVVNSLKELIKSAGKELKTEKK